ncbi:MAG: hypothetical protein ABSC13_06460 [Dehalococcoidia bacterium]|jgi:hypothetical protein
MPENDNASGVSAGGVDGQLLDGLPLDNTPALAIPSTAIVPVADIPVNGSRPTRRSRDDIEQLRRLLMEVVAEQQPMTVRQVFYQMVSRGAIDKTENEYKQTVIRLLTEMRLAGRLPYGWIADNTRWMRKPTTYSSLEEAILRTARFYRRSLWDEQDAYVEVWCEKDALAGVLYDVTGQWDVPLMVTRGYPSLSYLHEASETIAEQDRPVYLYYFGDYDPSGVDIARVTEKRLREFAPDAELYFEVLGVTPKQIAAWNLPTRPTKRGDSRYAGFRGESVEVDAIPPATLRRLTTDAIDQHVDPAAIEGLEEAEHDERKMLLMFANRARSGGAA